MAKDASFDVVSEVDMQEVDNGVNQAIKEIRQRFDFKGTITDITLEGAEIKILADDEFLLKSAIDVLQNKLSKRKIPLKSLSYGKIEPASKGTVRQAVTVQRGISKEKGKEIVAAIKDLKLKVQAQIMEDKVRVSAKKLDDLQLVIQKLKETDFKLDLQFENYRS